MEVFEFGKSDTLFDGMFLQYNNFFENAIIFDNLNNWSITL